MNIDSWPRSRVMAISGVVLVVVVAVVVIVLVSGGSSKTTTAGTAAPSGSLVLGPGDAKSLGFATTVRAAKKGTVKDQKGCTDSEEAVYEDAPNKTGLVSDVLICKSTTAASSALAKARKEVTVDSSVHPPAELGAEAFATASNASEYLMVWRAGNKVAVTAIDLDVTATSSSTTAGPPPLTAAQEATLKQAALHQNSLY